MIVVALMVHISKETGADCYIGARMFCQVGASCALVVGGAKQSTGTSEERASAFDRRSHQPPNAISRDPTGLRRADVTAAHQLVHVAVRKLEEVASIGVAVAGEAGVAQHRIGVGERQSRIVLAHRSATNWSEELDAVE